MNEQFLDEWLNQNLTQHDLAILRDHARFNNLSLSKFIIRILEKYVNNYIEEAYGSSSDSFGLHGEW